MFCVFIKAYHVVYREHAEICSIVLFSIHSSWLSKASLLTWFDTKYRFQIIWSCKRLNTKISKDRQYSKSRNGDHNKYHSSSWTALMELVTREDGSFRFKDFLLIIFIFEEAIKEKQWQTRMIPWKPFYQSVCSMLCSQLKLHSSAELAKVTHKAPFVCGHLVKRFRTVWNQSVGTRPKISRTVSLSSSYTAI